MENKLWGGSVQALTQEQRAKQLNDARDPVSYTQLTPETSRSAIYWFALSQTVLPARLRQQDNNITATDERLMISQVSCGRE